MIDANAESQNAWRIAYAKVVAKSWNDQTFKARLLSEPEKVLAEVGVSVPSNRSVRVIEDTDTLVHIVLPLPPEGDLSDEALDAVAAGTFSSPTML